MKLQAFYRRAQDCRNAAQTCLVEFWGKKLERGHVAGGLILTVFHMVLVILVENSDLIYTDAGCKRFFLRVCVCCLRDGVFLCEKSLLALLMLISEAH